MSTTLYTAPNCIRCKIIKKYFADTDTPYETIDFKEDSDTFNKFYRTNRKAIYRNSEGVEFPLYQSDDVIKQGSGEVLAWLLGQGALKESVKRSDMLHGKIAGLYPGMCPAGQEENFTEIIQRLSDGGLEVWLETDGRHPDLLEKLLKIKNTHAILNIVGDEETAKEIFGGIANKEELKKSIDLVLASPGGRVRFLIMPIKNGDNYQWADPEQAAKAAKIIADAYGKPTLPITVEKLSIDTPWPVHGLTPVAEADLLKYRNALRKHLFKAEVGKN